MTTFVGRFVDVAMKPWLRSVEHTVFVGDETSVGLALALRMVNPTGSVRHLFESSAIAELEAVLDTFGVTPVAIAPTGVDAVGAGELDLPLMAELRSEPSCRLVLAGNQATIKSLSAAVRDNAFQPSAVMVEA